MQEQDKSRDQAIVDHILGEPELPPAPPLQGVPDGQGDSLPPDPDGTGIPIDRLEALALEPANDTGNGKRFLAHFGDDLLHVREIGWHKWVGTHFEIEGGEEFAGVCAQNTAARIALEANFIAATPIEAEEIADGEDALRDLKELSARPAAERSPADKDRAAALQARIDLGKKAEAKVEARQIARRRFAVTSGNTSKIKGMMAQAINLRTIAPEELDADPLAFNCASGTLIFSRIPDPDGSDHADSVLGHIEQRGHDRADCMTKCAPVDYDPEAKCPKFLAFIEKVQPTPAVRIFLQTYYGLSLTGLTEQLLIFNYGSGANGKSTLAEIFARITGGYTQTVSFDSLTDEGFGRRGDQATPDLARLPGARHVRASEPKRGVVLDEALVKSLTGGEPMLVRHLHKGFFEYLPVFKLNLSGNHKPEIRGGDLGIWRRVCLVPWLVTIPKEDRRAFAEVIAEFWEERAGILNWFIEGAKRYLAEGLQIPDEVKVATEAYREEMDPIENFVRDCLDKTNGAEDRVAGADLYRAYEEWCAAQPLRAWKPNSFGTAFIAKGFEKIRTAKGSFYLGLRLKDERPRRDPADRRPSSPDETVPI